MTLKGVYMVPENRYTYASSIDNSLIHSEWGAQNIPYSHQGALQTKIEKHCNRLLKHNLLLDYRAVEKTAKQPIYH